MKTVLWLGVVMWVAAPIREAHIRLDQFKGHMRDEKYWRPAVRGNPEIIQLTVAGVRWPSG